MQEFEKKINDITCGELESALEMFGSVDIPIREKSMISFLNRYRIDEKCMDLLSGYISNNAFTQLLHVSKEALLKYKDKFDEVIFNEMKERGESVNPIFLLDSDVSVHFNCIDASEKTSMIRNQTLSESDFLLLGNSEKFEIVQAAIQSLKYRGKVADKLKELKKVYGYDVFGDLLFTNRDFSKLFDESEIINYSEIYFLKSEKSSKKLLLGISLYIETDSLIEKMLESYESAYDQLPYENNDTQDIINLLFRLSINQAVRTIKILFRIDKNMFTKQFLINFLAYKDPESEDDLSKIVDVFKAAGAERELAIFAGMKNFESLIVLLALSDI